MNARKRRALPTYLIAIVVGISICCGNQYIENRRLALELEDHERILAHYKEAKRLMKLDRQIQHWLPYLERQSRRRPDGHSGAKR